MLVCRKDFNYEENYKIEQELINFNEYIKKGDKSEGDYFCGNEEGNEINIIIFI